jgi:peptide/nickel transport system substrate-binding protein
VQAIQAVHLSTVPGATDGPLSPPRRSEMISALHRRPVARPFMSIPLPCLRRLLPAAAVLIATLLGAPIAHAQGKALRFASAFDPQSMDPHAIALLYQSRVVTQVYESLVNRDRDFKLEPALAMSWETPTPTAWRFKLRPNVRFHDGTPFTADDAVFSIQRALAKPSQRANQLRGITAVRKLDELTIEVQLAAPDAVLPEKFQFVGMMSKAWSEKNDVTTAQDFNAKQETFAVRNANGTGPFMLKSYEPDRRLVLVRNAAWWGWAVKTNDGNVREVSYTVIQSDATRLAALASGEVDFVIDPPFQDIARIKADARLKTVSTTDIGMQYLGFDQARAELEGSGVKGNPFRDLRVRQAVAHAINVPLIIDKVLRGQGTPIGMHLSPLVDGVPTELDKRIAHDPERARTLLREAGYPNGFAVQLDCVNVTFRAAVCQSIAAMLAQVGIKVTFQPHPAATFFPRLTQANTSFFEFGWSPGADAWAALNSIVRTHDGVGSGAFNGGRYSNPKLDALIDAMRVEPNLAKRRQLTADALRLMQADLPLIPLYRRTLTWVMRPNITAVPWPNDILELRWVQIK